MKYTELKNSIKEGAKQIYLLEGDDAYFRSNGEEMIKEAFLQTPELNFTVFDGENLKGAAISQLVSTIKNYPFMAEKRLVKVVEFYPGENEFDVYLKKLFDDFPTTTVLIIVNSQTKRGVDLKRKHSVTYVDCNRSDQETVAKWIYITLRRAKVSASVSVCENIAAYCLCNMARVAVETQKIIDFKGAEGGELTESEAEELVCKDAEYRLYELTNAAARKNYDKFCVISEDLIKKSGDETFVLSGLFNFYKNLLTAELSPERDSVLAENLKMKEYAVKKIREQASFLGEKKLSAHVSELYGLISGVKSGKITPETAYALAMNFIFFSDN